MKFMKYGDHQPHGGLVVKLIGIARKRVKRGPMELLSEVEITTEAGLDGDFRGKGGSRRTRQVTILSLKQWQDACDTVVAELPWQERRSNLLVDDVVFGQRDLDERLRIGSTVV